ncbi:hypothetical protein D3C81_2293980 [compost metagenome]
MGPSSARAYTWDGAKWSVSSDWLQADQNVLGPLLKESVDRHLAEKKQTRRAADDCNS